MSPDHVDALVIFGATGDLAKLETFPALVGLVDRGVLDVPVLGVAKSGWGLPQFREYAAASLKLNNMDPEAPAAVKMLDQLRYVDGDLGDHATYEAMAAALGPGAKRILYYLEVPPFLFGRIAEGISGVGLAAQSRVMVEKPFGNDLASAQELNETIHKYFPEESVYRVDHWLGFDPLESLMFARFANSIVEPLLNRNYVESIQITMAEAFDVADRGSFYDRTGAIKDVIQNHMLQVLATVLADPPDGAGLDSWISSKSQLINALRPLTPANVIKGQYEGYQSVAGVAPGSSTETYAAVRLTADTWRWAGVPIVIRAGKCLPVTATDVLIDFKPVPHDVFGLGEATTTKNALRFRIYPESQAVLTLVGKKPGAGWEPEVQDLTFIRHPGADMRAYDRLIGAALNGERWLFAQQDTVEAAWRVVDLVVGDVGPVVPYARGSWGPDSSSLLPAGENWYNPSALSRLSPVATWIISDNAPGTGPRVAVKDLIDMAGLPTTAGSRPVANRAVPAARDAACLAGLRTAMAAGQARFAGKTNLHELAYGITGINAAFGTPVNPLDPRRMPGGSSSGSATAVAAGEADIAYGTDTGGSIRIPAACCGITGLKTTWGRVSTDGVWPLAYGLDTVGPMARDVAGVAAGMALLEPGFSVAETAPQTIGVLAIEADPQITAAIDGALRTAEFDVVPVSIPGLDEVITASLTVLAAQAWQANKDLVAAAADQLGDDVRSRLTEASTITPAQVSAAEAVLARWRSTVDDLWQRVEVLAAPSILGFPPLLDEPHLMWKLRGLTSPVNAAGLPALALPVPAAGRDAGPIPASVQLIGPRDSEDRLLAAGALLERAIRALHREPRCSGRICRRQIQHLNRVNVAQSVGMAQESKIPVFTEQVRLSLLQRRVLVLDGVLDDDNGTLLAAQLLTLADEDPDTDVALWINSPGGSVPSMLAIRDIMRLIPCDVATLVFGIAYSAGQFLLSSGTRGKRYALPHSRILMHQGSAGIGGSAVEVELQAADLRLTRDTVLGLIAEDTGQPLERIFEDSRHDHWYTAPEAKDYGFIDGIAETFGQLMPAKKRPFGLRPSAALSTTGGAA